jgi:hypothetical protein
MITVKSPRRSVLKGLTLGAGATVLNPLLSRFVREARGAASDATRVVFVMSGNGMNAEAKGPLDLVTIAR